MSRVEEFRISRNFPASGVEPIKKMASHLGRRGERRTRVVAEISASNPEPDPKREPPERERARDDKKIEIVAQWPLGSGRKRY